MAERSQEETNAIMAGMEAVWAEEARRAPLAPRCHMKPMKFEFGDGDEAWWECDHCGHTKDIQDTTGGKA